jgi:hypothetical protein
MGGLHGWVERWCRYGSVYIASLRLGGRKLPTYELMLHLLGVATMYASVYIDSLRLGGRKLPTYELMLRLLGVTTMYGWIYYISVMYKNDVGQGVPYSCEVT